MKKLIEGAVDRVRMVLSIMVFCLVAGFLAYVNLPKEADPDIPIPFVGVTLPLEGISPEDAERLLVRPSEVQLQQIEGLKQMDGIAAEGAGQIILEFDVSFDADQAVLDVREKIDMAEREFPDDTRPAVITEVNANLFPIMTINLWGDVPERGLVREARALKQRLESLPTVLEARIIGEREEVLEVIIDPAKLETYNLSYVDVLQAVTANNRLVPAGRLDLGKGRFPVKVPGLIESARDALAIPVLRTENAVVTLGEIADVRRTFKDREVYSRFNGKPSLAIEIVKRTGANIVATTQSVRADLALAEARWPDNLHATITGDLSEWIFDTLTSLESSILTAVLLVMIIVLGALGLRSGILVGVAIPSSFLLAFLLLGVAGYTINMMVMFGMVIAVGILVDGAIVVVEYADRKMAEGMHRKQAYTLAAQRMFWPVVSSTLTTLAAFLPFLFWNSIPGKFMSYLPITLIFVLTASLIVALIFTPVLGSVIGGRESRDDNLAAIAAEGDPFKTTGALRVYVEIVAETIRRPLLVLGVTGTVIFGIVSWFASTPHKTEFFLDAEPEQIYVFVGARGNYSAAEEFAMVQQVEAKLADIPGIESIIFRSGSLARGGTQGDGVQDVPVDTIGRLLIDLTDRGTRPDGRQIEAEIRRRVANLNGMRAEVVRLEQGPPQGKDIQIELTSDNGPALTAAAAKVRAHLESMSGLIELEDTRPQPGIEWQLDVDRAEAAKFGVDVAQVGAAVQLVTNGILVGRFRPDDAFEEVDIRVRLPAEDRTLDELDRLRISTPGGPVPLSIFVDRFPAQRIDKIDRRDGQRVLIVRSNVVEQGTAAQNIAEIQTWIEANPVSRDVTVTFAGSNQETEEAAGFFAVAFIAALFLMAIILLWQFNNFYHVLLTLTAVLISSVGVLLAIQVALPYVSFIMVGTGIVALAGIVVNNNIILIDTYQRLRQDGRTSEQAAIATAAQRIRPITLTTGTTLIGLLPMVFQWNLNFVTGTMSVGGAASEWWVPLATAVVWGLGASTITCLFVTPMLLTLPDRIGRAAMALRAGWRKPEPHANLAE